MTIHWKAVEQYFVVVFVNFTQFVSSENLSNLDLALFEVKGLNTLKTPIMATIRHDKSK